MQELQTMTNLILIAGTGRNVGKTLLACEIIGYLAKQTEVVSIKISHHLHPTEIGQKTIANTPHYTIIEEQLINNKDSSRMKQAGAVKNFYIQTDGQHILETFNLLLPEMQDRAVVCESGGLRKFVEPALFLLVKGEEMPESKSDILHFTPVVVQYANGKPNINVAVIHFNNNCLLFNKIKNEQI